MLITAIGMNEGFSGARRARRYFENGSEVRLEVLDQDDDPPDINGQPDPARIGRRTYQALRDDPRIKLLSDGETVATHSTAAFEEARRSAERAATEAVGLKIEVARLRDENEHLRKQVSERGGAAPHPEADHNLAKSATAAHDEPHGKRK